MKRLLLASLFLLLPFAAHSGFPEDKDGYDIDKIREAFRLPCKDIGKHECISRALGIGACTWIFEVNRGVENVEALKTGDMILMALVGFMVIYSRFAVWCGDLTRAYGQVFMCFG